MLHTMVRPDSKITVTDVKPAWEDGDKLKITAKNDTVAVSELSVYEIDSQNPTKASFTGFVTMKDAPEYCYFTYPASAATSVNRDNGRVVFQYNNQTGRHEPFMYANTGYDEQGMSVTMQHAGAVLELDVRIDGISTITFAGNRLESLYPLEINPETGDRSVTSTVGLQITVPIQAEGKTYICVPPVKMDKGFSLVLSKEDGSYMVKSFSSDGTLSGGYDFFQKIGSIIPIEISGNFEGFSISASDLSSEHTKNGNLLTGTKVAFKMSKSGAPNKLVEEWGANLYDSKGTLVRSIKYTADTPIKGESITMNIENNWKLLPAGTYTFTPYYKMYGQPVTLSSEILTISNPGVTVTLNGTTSYDKYKAGNVSGANSHTSTLIEGVSVSTNLDQSVIDSRTVTLDGTSLGDGTWSSGTISYGNLTRTSYKAYPFKATIKVGNLTFEASRDFHITGLPYEVNFTSGDNSSWSKLGAAEYSENRITFAGGYGLSGSTDAAVVSPAFFIPESISVVTAVDACYKGERYIYIQPIRQDPSSISFSDYSVKVNVPDKNWYGTYKDLTSKGYAQCSTKFNLSTSSPALMYAANVAVNYNMAIYKIKIQYN